MERRRCFIRRAGENTAVEEVTGFYVCGVYCSEKLRSNGMATSMMFRLLGAASGPDDVRQGLPFAKVQDLDDEYLPYVSVIQISAFERSQAQYPEMTHASLVGVQAPFMISS